MITSLITGILIGLEREVRGKSAGLRTHALVCFASTLVMLAAARQAQWHVEFLPGGTIVTDPTRMAHGVLTGIGFLCAGVIFRDGASVRGLTTAASLWATASIGLLYGVGMYWLAVSGTILTLLVLSMLRLIQYLMPQRLEARLVVITDGGDGFTAATLREILARRGLRAGAVGWNATGSVDRLELSVRTWFRNERQADELVQAIAESLGVVGFAVVPARDDAATETLRD
ncbi:MAG TPA: MgtC/SapB family protein [Burkholderiales bacterium]|nr:MgtC/SapB family protein [Burkholderiales bacterium]